MAQARQSIFGASKYERIDIHTPDRSLIERIESSGEGAGERLEMIIGTRVVQCTFQHLGDLSRFEQRLVKGAFMSGISTGA